MWVVVHCRAFVAARDRFLIVCLQCVSLLLVFH